MKHIMLDGTNWIWDTDPYPKYSVSLNFGRHLKDTAQIPVLGGLIPEDGALPEGNFKIASSKEGTIVIVPGKDETNRLFLMTGISAGHRGSCGFEKESTTGRVLKTAQTGNTCSGRIELAVLLEVDQKLILWSDGSDGTLYVVHTYDGEKLSTKYYSPEEWTFVNSPYYLEDDVDINYL